MYIKIFDLVTRVTYSVVSNNFVSNNIELTRANIADQSKKKINAKKII
jgi:hypothetical protein